MFWNHRNNHTQIDDFRKLNVAAALTGFEKPRLGVVGDGLRETAVASRRDLKLDMPNFGDYARHRRLKIKGQRVAQIVDSFGL